MGVGNTNYSISPFGEKDKFSNKQYAKFTFSNMPWNFQCAECKVKKWRNFSNTTIFCVTGGEKWKCKGYKTETPGQLNNADKERRSQWKSISELRATGEYTKPPQMGYYFEDGVKKFGERHPNYGR